MADELSGLSAQFFLRHGTGCFVYREIDVVAAMQKNLTSDFTFPLFAGHNTDSNL